MTDLPDSTRWQLWIVAFGFFMQSLDTTIVNTALPSMAQSLGESPLHMHMVIVSYVLTVAVMLPASGWLADKVGVRNIFFTAIVLFTLGSLFCALSGTLNELLLARALQGVGGAMLDWALDHGFDYVSTGHYARVERDGQSVELALEDIRKCTIKPDFSASGASR